jgi:hypothetical protein
MSLNLRRIGGRSRERDEIETSEEFTQAGIKQAFKSSKP